MIVAQAFVALQEVRHRADYDPVFRVTRQDALAAVAQADFAIGELTRSALRDRTALAIHLLLRRARSP